MTELAEKITFIKNNEIYNKFGLEKGIKLYDHLKEKNGIPKDLDLAVLKELGIGKNDDITKIMIAYNGCKQLEGLRDFAGTINLMDSQKRQEGLETLQNILIHMSFNNSLYDDDQIPYMKNNTSEFDQADYNLKTQGNLYGAKGSRSTPVKGAGSKTIKTTTAEDVNNWWKTEKGYDSPPYKPGTQVTQIELTENTRFVRVYDGKISKMYGGWVMKAEDIQGLTPLQIQNKYALPSTPKYICDVEIPVGTNLRTGIANEVANWGSGGGTQYDLMGQTVGTFGNERLLP